MTFSAFNEQIVKITKLDLPGEASHHKMAPIERLEELTKESLKNTLQQIRETYHIVYNYIYVLQSKGNLDELFITYNIDTSRTPDRPLEDTILVHRKKQSNTLYTINALNELVKEENNGVLDKKFAIDWEKFRNSIKLTL